MFFQIFLGSSLGTRGLCIRERENSDDDNNDLGKQSKEIIWVPMVEHCENVLCVCGRHQGTQHKPQSRLGLIASDCLMVVSTYSEATVL